MYHTSGMPAHFDDELPSHGLLVHPCPHAHKCNSSLERPIVDFAGVSFCGAGQE